MSSKERSRLRTGRGFDRRRLRRELLPVLVVLGSALGCTAGTGAPALTVSPASLAFQATLGGSVTPSGSTLTLTNSGSAPLRWAIAPDDAGSWVTLSAADGLIATSGGTSQVQVGVDLTDPALSGEGIYTSVLTVAGLNAGPPVTVAVELTLTGNPILSVSPGSFSFTVVQGAPSPPTQSIGVSSLTRGTRLSWSALASATPASWLSVAPASGTAALGFPAATSMTLATQGLPVGVYSGSVTVTANDALGNPAQGSPVTVTVSLVVQGPAACTVSLPPTGYVCAVAGDGFPGTPTLGVPATSTTLNLPYGIAYDKGLLLDAESLSYGELFGVNVTGAPSTPTSAAGKSIASGNIDLVAGGGFTAVDPATASQAFFFVPLSAVTDPRGVVYVAEATPYGGRIRVVNPMPSPVTFCGGLVTASPGAVTTVAGGGGGWGGVFSPGAQPFDRWAGAPTSVNTDFLGQPLGLAVSGPLVFAADPVTSVIWLMNLGDSAFQIPGGGPLLMPCYATIVAGTGVAGNGPAGVIPWSSMFDMPFGLALGPTGAEYVTVYVADFGNQRVRSIYLAGGPGIPATSEVTDVFPTPGTNPLSVVADPGGILFLTEGTAILAKNLGGGPVSVAGISLGAGATGTIVGQVNRVCDTASFPFWRCGDGLPTGDPRVLLAPFALALDGGGRLFWNEPRNGVPRIRALRLW